MRKLIYALVILFVCFVVIPMSMADGQHTYKQPASAATQNAVLRQSNDNKDDTILALIKQLPETKTRTIYRTKVRTVVVHDTLFYPTAATEPTDYDIEPTCTTDTVYVHDTITRRRTLAAWLKGH